MLLSLPIQSSDTDNLFHPSTKVQDYHTKVIQHPLRDLNFNSSRSTPQSPRVTLKTTKSQTSLLSHRPSPNTINSTLDTSLGDKVRYYQSKKNPDHFPRSPRIKINKPPETWTNPTQSIITPGENTQIPLILAVPLHTTSSQTCLERTHSPPLTSCSPPALTKTPHTNSCP